MKVHVESLGDGKAQVTEEEGKTHEAFLDGYQMVLRPTAPPADDPNCRLTVGGKHITRGAKITFEVPPEAMHHWRKMFP